MLLGTRSLARQAARSRTVLQAKGACDARGMPHDTANDLPSNIMRRGGHDYVAAAVEVVVNALALRWRSTGGSGFMAGWIGPVTGYACCGNFDGAHPFLDLGREEGIWRGFGSGKLHVWTSHRVFCVGDEVEALHPEHTYAASDAVRAHLREN